MNVFLLLFTATSIRPVAIVSTAPIMWYKETRASTIIWDSLINSKCEYADYPPPGRCLTVDYPFGYYKMVPDAKWWGRTKCSTRTFCASSTSFGLDRSGILYQSLDGEL